MRVSLCGEFNGWSQSAIPMKRHDGHRSNGNRSSFPTHDTVGEDREADEIKHDQRGQYGLNSDGSHYLRIHSAKIARGPLSLNSPGARPTQRETLDRRPLLWAS